MKAPERHTRSGARWRERGRRRIGERDRLVSEIAAWERQRNAPSARVNWMFTTEKARAKWAAPIPSPQPNQVKAAKSKTSVSRYYSELPFAPVPCSMDPGVEVAVDEDCLEDRQSSDKASKPAPRHLSVPSARSVSADAAIRRDFAVRMSHGAPVARSPSNRLRRRQPICQMPVVPGSPTLPSSSSRRFVPIALGGIFCDFARGGASRIKGLDDARG